LVVCRSYGAAATADQLTQARDARHALAVRCSPGVSLPKADSTCGRRLYWLPLDAACLVHADLDGHSMGRVMEREQWGKQRADGVPNNGRRLRPVALPRRGQGRVRRLTLRRRRVCSLLHRTSDENRPACAPRPTTLVVHNTLGTVFVQPIPTQRSARKVSRWPKPLQARGLIKVIDSSFVVLRFKKEKSGGFRIPEQRRPPFIHFPERHCEPRSSRSLPTLASLIHH
jgi:hypothetical protein